MKLQINEFPEDMSRFFLDPEQLEKLFVTGLYREEVVSGEGEKLAELLTYLPENGQNGWPQLLVAMPCEEEPEMFLQNSGLLELAENKHLLIHVLEPVKGAHYPVKEALAQISARKRYVGCANAIYLLGVGSGCQAAYEMALKECGAIAGMILADGNWGACLALDREYPGRESIRLPMPVWFWDSGQGQVPQELIGEWRMRNHCRQIAELYSETEMFYGPSRLMVADGFNDEGTAPVRITRNRGSWREYLEEFWDFLRERRRYKGAGHAMLRVCGLPQDLKAVPREMVHAGYRRRWYEYVPESALKKEAEGGCPVVVVLHGRGGTPETFFDTTRMWQVARQRGFIALFPAAFCYQQYPPDGIRNVTMWDYPNSDKSSDNVGFIRAMIADVRKRYPVDASRIYCCGQSSGGMMTMELALYASDLFAAAAPWSTASTPDGIRSTTKEAIPVFLTRGKLDGLKRQQSFPEYPFRCNTIVKGMLDYFLERYHLEKTAREYTSGIYHFYIYETAKGVPMVTFADVEDMPHANIPEESYLSYDLFFSRFSRAADGKLLYMGKEVV